MYQKIKLAFCSEAKERHEYERQRAIQNIERSKREADEEKEKLAKSINQKDTRSEQLKKERERVSRFSSVSQFLERVLMEHIESICSLESKLTFMSICSIRIPSRNRDISAYFQLTFPLFQTVLISKTRAKREGIRRELIKKDLETFDERARRAEVFAHMIPQPAKL